ncbi:hypothetical protein IGI37_003747 [Enterococcus sp. AZ194]|uniref:hypothetical protein n=1 Tax=Enterococcus sp. AZ194 TaxID=2774629 RepID=UPI003F217BA6
MKIIPSQTCGNSPKNQFVETYSIHLLTKNQNELNNLTDSAIMIQLPNGPVINSLTDLDQLELAFETLTCLVSIAHGRHGSFLGAIRQKDSEKLIAVHYEFKTLKADKIKHVTLFEPLPISQTT